MKSGRAQIGLFQKMRIKNLFTLGTSKNHLIRNFLRNGRLRVNAKNLKSNILAMFIFSGFYPKNTPLQFFIDKLERLFIYLFVENKIFVRSLVLVISILLNKGGT